MKKKILILLVFLLGLFLFSGCEEKLTENPKANKKENLPLTEGIFKDYYKDAYELVKQMTLEEKVGQLFLVRYNAQEVTNNIDYYPGGYILFAKDFQDHTKESIKEELERAQKNNKYRLILGVDEEGGFVTRISRYRAYRDATFKSPKAYYEEGGYELLEQTEKEKAQLLKELGLNLNLAPVADISTNENDFIYNRAFGKGAEETSTFVANMVKYANGNGMGSCLKHFPGYGNNLDTHTGIAIDDRSYDNFVENDFKPFQAGIEAGAPSVLVSHNIVKSMDENYPASLSEKVIKELRETLGFTGIVMTDDLAMDAVKSYVEDGNAATMAINAGNDMIITSDFIEMKEEIIESVNTGKITEETLNKAVMRIIAWKYYSGLLEK